MQGVQELVGQRLGRHHDNDLRYDLKTQCPQQTSLCIPVQEDAHATEEDCEAFQALEVEISVTSLSSEWTSSATRECCP